VNSKFTKRERNERERKNRELAQPWLEDVGTHKNVAMVGAGLKSRDESEDCRHYRMGGVAIRNGVQARERVSDD